MWLANAIAVSVAKLIIAYSDGIPPFARLSVACFRLASEAAAGAETYETVSEKQQRLLQESGSEVAAIAVRQRTPMTAQWPHVCGVSEKKQSRETVRLWSAECQG